MQDEADRLREQKQRYLCEEILDKEYDANGFQEYILSMKEDGANIDVWSFAELKDLVSRFQKMNPKQGSEEKAAPPPEEEKRDEPVLRVDQKARLAQNIQLREQAAFEFFKEVECKALDQVLLESSDEIPVIEVTGYEKKAGGFFSSGYILYTVETKSLQWAAKRKIADFVWLRSFLRKHHLGLLLPPLVYTHEVSENKKILKNIRYLELFLQRCILSSSVRRSQVFIDFLNIDEQSWAEKKKALDKLPEPKRIEDYYSATGKMILSISHVNFAFNENIRLYITEGDMVYKLSLIHI
eukprot:TRINITY_DN12343_c0_g1_i1.p1 TRINITY_DN12343_c0_g1~~TRINITY_DN12343_c0_g1_i1.p1  ORF type:complete len:297 (-),score=81.30 TRINITY_DN12343_c0_g1_i1:61-951(-)